MHSSSEADTRSTAAFNARAYTSSMPSDHASTWDRQVLSREKIDRAEKDRHTAGKKEWPPDRSSGQASHRPSSTLGVNGSVPGPPSKRRAVGRHGALIENGRCGTIVGRSSDFWSAASPAENGKTEKDARSLSGVPSPGYSESPGSEKSNKDLDFREQHLSSADGRLPLSPGMACSPRDPAFRPFGGQTRPEMVSLWDRERSKFSSSPGWEIRNRERDYRERIRSKPEVYKKTGSLFKLDSGRDWSLGDRELEGRVDRYGSASNRENTSFDALSGSKEHSRHDWRIRDRASFSSRFPACGTCVVKDTGAELLEPDVSETASPQYSLLQGSTVHESGQDDVGHTSPKKRPRLTWGQGLAQYEKEKVEDSPAVVHISQEGSNQQVSCGLQAGGSVGVDHSVVTPKDDSIQAPSQIICPLCAEPSHSTDFKSSFENGSVRLFPAEPQHSPICAKQETSTWEKADEQDGISKNFDTSVERPVSNVIKPFVPTAVVSQCSVICDAQALLAGYRENTAVLSKDLLMQQVEKVELEIEHVEKELVKLENDNESLYKSAKNSKLETTAEDWNVSCHVNSLTELSTMQHEAVSPAHCVVQMATTQGGHTMENDVLHCDPDARMYVSEGVEDTTQKVCDGPEKHLVGISLVVCQQANVEVAETNLDVPALTAGNVRPDDQQVDATVCKENMCTKSSAVGLQNLLARDIYQGGKFVSSLLQANKEMAKCSLDCLAHLLPSCSPSDRGEDGNLNGKLYNSPQEAVVWRRNVESHERKSKFLESKIAKRKGSLIFMERVLAVKYRALRLSWKREQVSIDLQRERGETSQLWEPEQGNESAASSQLSCLRLYPLTCPTVPQGVCEKVQLVTKCISGPPFDHQRVYEKMPSMHLDDKERDFHKFVTNNSLVADPVAAEQERMAVNPWSGEERKVFLDKYALYGKNFSKIATFLEHKTVADCVQFYYRNQKSEDFEKVHRRHQLKKRRDYSRSSASYLATTTSVNSRHREVNAAAHAEGLRLVAAAAAAMSASRDFSKAMWNGIGQDKLATSDVPAHVGLSTAAANSCPINNAGVKVSRDKNSYKQGSNVCVPVRKSNQGEQQSGMKGARSMHARSQKGPAEEIDLQWTDSERLLFTAAVAMFGKDFHSISLHIGTKSQGQCKVFFSKARKRLGLDQLVERHKSMQQVCINTTTDAAEQTAADEYIKPLENGGEAVDVGSKCGGAINVGSNGVDAESQAGQAIKIIERGGSEVQVRNEGQVSDVELALVKESNNVFDVQGVVTMHQEEIDCQHGVILSGVESFQSGTEAGLIDNIVPDISHVSETMPIAYNDVVKEEGSSSIDNGALTMGISQDSEQLKAAPVAPVQSYSQEASLVCAETLQFKTEPMSIDMEPVTARNTVPHVSNTKTHLVPLSEPLLVVPSLLSSSGTAAMAQPASVRDKGFRVVETKSRREPTSWTPEEKEKFFDIIKTHGKDWDRLRDSLPAKSLTQIKTYFQNSKAKLALATEGTVTGSGRGGTSRKRKADDSDSSSNAGSGGQIVPQKVALHSDDGNLKVSPSVLVPTGVLGSNLIGAEAFTYSTLFGRNSGQILEDPINAQNVFHAMGLAQNSNTPGIIPMFNSNVFVPSSLHTLPESYTQPVSLKTQQLANHQQPQSSLPSLVVVQPLQQQSPPVVMPQQLQSTSRNHHELPLPAVQHLHKHASKQPLQPAVQQQQQAQQLQQQMTEAVLQQHLQPHLVQRKQQQQQQFQLTAQQGPQHLQQVLSQHQVQSHQQPLSQCVSQQLQVASNQVVSQQQATSSHLKATSQQQQLLGQYQSHLFESYLKSQSLLQQKLTPQQQQQLQHYLQQRNQLHLQNQQQQAHQQLQQVQAQQVQQQICQLQQQSFQLHHEQEQQQLALVKGIMQISSTSSEVQKVCDSDLQIPVTFQQAACKDVQQPLVAPHMSPRVPSKFQITSEAQVHAADVKLFGQSLLLQPASSSQQTSYKIPSSLSSQMHLSAASSSFSTEKSTSDAHDKGYDTVGDFFMQGPDWHTTRPGAPAGNFSGSNVSSILQRSTVGSPVNSELKPHSLQEAVARITQQIIREASGIEDSQVGYLAALSQLSRLQEGASFPNVLPSFERRAHPDPVSSHCVPSEEVRGLDSDSKTCAQLGGSDLGMPPIRGLDFNPPLMMMPGGQVAASQGLPRVLDALVALAEWQSQNASSGNGRSTEEFINQTWEALHRDSSLLVEAGKANGSLAQNYAGGAEMMQPLSNNVFPSLHHLTTFQAHTNVGGCAWGSSNSIHVNENQHGLTPLSSSFRSHSSIQNLTSSDEHGRVESRDLDGNGAMG